MPIVQRFFRQDSPEDDVRDKGEPRPLTNYLQKRVVVILGGPGIGKTTELRHAADRETDSIFCTVSEFLNDSIEFYRGKTIFMDALDEHRADTAQGTSIMKGIRGRLRALGCPKVRISCRSEEWHEGSDVKSLGDVAGNESVYVLKMLPLSEENIRAIAAGEIDDVDAFLAGAQERQLTELLGNPETLKLYLKVYQRSGGWPETRTELMRQSTDLLISEENEEHERARGTDITDEQLMAAAEDLSAFMLLGDKQGVALNKASGSDRYIPLQELPAIDLDACGVAVRRRLFDSGAPEQVHPQHKTTGDYLAARALVRRVREKSLPLGRALTLITGSDGRPLSHTRDVYAWIVAFLPEHAVRLIQADPFGVLIYGDAGQWSVDTRRTALKLLSVYAVDRDPWFRADAWYAPLLGGLAHQELIEDFRNVLKTEPSPHVTSVVLSALEHGPRLPELGDDLLSFIRDPGRPHHDWLRDDALRVFTRVCPERLDDRKALLEDLTAGVVSDDGLQIRTALLHELYPSELGPDKIVHYFGEADLVGTSSMDWFVRHDLVEKTPATQLPLLAEAILSNPHDMKKLGEFDRRGLNGALVCRLLATCGEKASPAQIYAWLGIYMDRNHDAHLDTEDAGYIRSYLETRPDLYVELFRYWLDQTVPDAERNYWFHYTWSFSERMLRVTQPKDFPKTLLTWAALETDAEKSAFLFEEAVDLAMNRDPGEYGVGLEELCEFVELNPRFEEIWERKRTRPIPEWKTEQALKSQQHRAEREQAHARDIRILSSRLDDLRNGKDLQNLDCGAHWWFGLTYDSRDVDEPIERIRRRTNQVIAEALTEGFEALLKSNRPQTPSDITKLNCKGRRYFGSYPILAGADIVATRSREEFLALPDPNLKAALAYHLVLHAGHDARVWDRLIVSSRPDVAREVLAEIWRVELDCGKKEHLTGAYVGDTQDSFTPIVLSEIPVLIDEIPALPPRILEDLLIVILKHGDAETLQPLAIKALADSRVRREARTLWLAIAALLSPAVHAHQLDRRMHSSSRDAWATFRILTAGAGILMNGRDGAPQLQMSISLLGGFFNNVPFPRGVHTIGREDASEAAQSIRGLIHILAGLATDSAARAFEVLAAEPALHEWHDHIRHSQSIQAKNLRDASFTRHSVREVCTLLSGGAPASMKDFLVLAVDILDDLAAEIRGDNANMWKSFWTLAGKGDLDKPKIENDCRDTLLPWIRPYLTSRDITIEPEGAAADQKRADIRMTSAAVGTLPIEVKRDDNGELWTAMNDQLLPRYANDPKTGGYGIYLVFWYGKAGNGCTSPPKEFGIGAPTTAPELQAALETRKPDPRFIVRVIDVSKPHD